MKPATLILMLMVAVPGAAADSESGWQCRQVIDGDTMIVQSDSGQELRVQLYGVDAPELEQPFGAEAKNFVEEAALGRIVTLSELGTEGVEPAIAWVEVGRDNLSLALVSAGLAWLAQERETSETLAIALFKARTAGVGLWSDAEAEPPWKWRERQRTRPTPTPRPRLSDIVSGIELSNENGNSVVIADIPPRYTSQRETQMLVENLAVIAAAAESLDEMDAVYARECWNNRSSPSEGGGSVWSDELNQWVDGTESTREAACHTLGENITRLRRSIVEARDRVTDEARRFGVKPHIIREVVDYFGLARF